VVRRIAVAARNTILAVLMVLSVAYAGLQATGDLRAVMVRTGSMAVPDGIPVGSLVLGWQTTSPAVGDVIIGVRDDGVTVTHRVIEVLPGGAYRMRGDANSAADAGAYRVVRGAHRAELVIPHVGRVIGAIITNPPALVLMGAVPGGLAGTWVTLMVQSIRQRRAGQVVLATDIPDGHGRHRA